MGTCSNLVCGARWPFWLAAWAVVVASSLIAALPASAAAPSGMSELCAGSGGDKSACDGYQIWAMDYTVACSTGETATYQGGPGDFVELGYPCSWYGFSELSPEGWESGVLTVAAWVGYGIAEPVGLTWEESASLSWLVVLAWVAAYALRFLGSAV